jgi:methyl-accepting chemotaxis protein
MDFKQAVAAHVAWKMKLEHYLARPGGSLDHLVVASEDSCSLGKWIQEQEKTNASDPNFRALREEHARFHRAAAEIVRRADLGEKVTAEIALGAKSGFGLTSGRVVQLIMAQQFCVAK